MYIIGTKTSKFINDKFFEVSFKGNGEDKVNRDDFDKLKSAKELHYLASIFNWDDDTEVLEWIINSPLCDKGTALLIFWSSQPDFYTRFENEQEAEYERDTFRLIRNIIKNYQDGFYKKARFRFNPRSAMFDVNYIDPRAKWEIPDEMKKEIIGLPVISIDDTRNFILNVTNVIWKNLKRKFRRFKKRPTKWSK